MYCFLYFLFNIKRISKKVVYEDISKTDNSLSSPAHTGRWIEIRKWHWDLRQNGISQYANHENTFWSGPSNQVPTLLIMHLEKPLFFPYFFSKSLKSGVHRDTSNQGELYFLIPKTKYNNNNNKVKFETTTSYSLGNSNYNIFLKI